MNARGGAALAMSPAGQELQGGDAGEKKRTSDRQGAGVN